MKQISTSQLLYDGLETDELYAQTFAINIGGQQIAFRISDFTQNRFSPERLRDVFTESELQRVVKASRLAPTSMGNYQADGLDAYYLCTEEAVLILSFGEFQPARYILSLESGWAKDVTP